MLRVIVVFGLVSAVAHVAAAQSRVEIKSGGELPADLAIDLPDGVIRQGSFSLPLGELFDVDPRSAGQGCEPKYVGASYQHKTHSLIVDETECPHFRLTIPRARILARLARAAGWNAETRGDLAAAKRQFEASLAGEPGVERVALDLARVELRLGDRAAAAATMRPFIAKAPVAHYAAYVEDAVFTPLLDEAPLSGLRTPVAGTARVDGLQARFVARSATHDLLALVHETPDDIGDAGGPGDGSRDLALVLLDTHGTVVATLSLVPRPPRALWRYDDLRDSADEVAVRLDVANRLLRDLGFDPLPDAEIAAFRRKGADTQVATFARAKLGVAVRAGGANLLDHDRSLATDEVYSCKTDSFNCDNPPTFGWAAWLPAQHLVLLSWSTSTALDNDAMSHLDVWQVPSR